MPALQPVYILASIIVAVIQIANVALAAAYVNVLKKKGYQVEYLADDFGWNGSDDNIIVEGIPLWDFVNNLEGSKHDILICILHAAF